MHCNYTIYSLICHHFIYKKVLIYDKIINNIKSINGWIEEPTTGKFYITFTQEETGNLNPGDYYLIIYMNSYDDTSINIISGEGTKSGILKICRQ